MISRQQENGSLHTGLKRWRVRRRKGSTDEFPESEMWERSFGCGKRYRSTCNRRTQLHGDGCSKRDGGDISEVHPEAKKCISEVHPEAKKYSQPTILIPQRRDSAEHNADKCIASANGVRQGDPLSSLLFCLYLKPAIDALVANADYGTRITVYAYVDDVHIVGSVDDVLSAHKAFIAHLRDIELTVNHTKCSLIYMHNHTHPLTVDQLVRLNDVNAPLQWDVTDYRSAGRAWRRHWRRCSSHRRAAAC